MLLGGYEGKIYTHFCGVHPFAIVCCFVFVHLYTGELSAAMVAAEAEAALMQAHSQCLRTELLRVERCVVELDGELIALRFATETNGQHHEFLNYVLGLSSRPMLS